MPAINPPANVLVAAVPVALKYGAAIFVPDSMPPEYVVVPVLEKRLRPEKRLESVRMVVEETVIVPPRETEEPLIVI